MNNFLQEYYFEKRWVYSQKINLDSKQTRLLIGLINENLKPENVKYKYDFFYDNCSTRIRDLLEKCTGDNLLYPPSANTKLPTFRELVRKYQSPLPWLQFGVDLLLGSPSDKRASFRDRMFLPLEMRTELSETVIRRSGKMIPLLQNPEVVLSFDPVEVKPNFLTSPAFVFTMVLILIVTLTGLLKQKKLIKILDISVFSIFSILSVLMIFTNFFSDHTQMKWNLNIIWLNPLIIICLFTLILNKPGRIWFKILFYILMSFLVLHLLLPQHFDIAIIPLLFILIIRSSVRAVFNWNPYFTPLD